MLKKVVAIVLILLTSGTWAYLDYLNKQEIQAAEELRQSMEQARAQARARADAKAKFETQIQADLAACKATAEKAKEDFLEAKKKPVKRKPGQFTVPAAAQEEANKMLEVANANCQAAYDARLASGK